MKNVHRQKLIAFLLTVVVLTQLLLMNGAALETGVSGDIAIYGLSMTDESGRPISGVDQCDDYVNVDFAMINKTSATIEARLVWALYRDGRLLETDAAPYTLPPGTPVSAHIMADLPANLSGLTFDYYLWRQSDNAPISTMAPAITSVSYLPEKVINYGEDVSLPARIDATYSDGVTTSAPVLWETWPTAPGHYYVKGLVGTLTVTQPVIILGRSQTLINYFDAKDTLAATAPTPGGSALQLNGSGATTNADGSFVVGYPVNAGGTNGYCFEGGYVKLQGVGKYRFTVYAATNKSAYASVTENLAIFNIKTYRDAQGSNSVYTTSDKEQPGSTFTVDQLGSGTDYVALSFDYEIDEKFLNSSGDTYAEFRWKPTQQTKAPIDIRGMSVIKLGGTGSFVDVDPADPRIQTYTISPKISDGLTVPAEQLQNLTLKGIVEGDKFIVAEDKTVVFTGTLGTGWSYNSTYSTFFKGDSSNAKVLTSGVGNMDRTFSYNAFMGCVLNLTDVTDLRINCTAEKLPRLYINPSVSLGSIDKINWVTCSYRLEAGTKQFDSGNTYESPNPSKDSIKGRGNTSWGQPKKPYSIKLDKKTSLLGIPETKKYAVVASYSDASLMRNYITYKAAQNLEGIQYQARAEMVEVYLNGSYNGVYILVERIDLEPTKVDITEITDPTGNITGGYVIEKDSGDKIDWSVDKLGETVAKWPYDRHGAGDYVTFKNPDPPTREMTNYIQNYLQAVHDSIIIDSPTAYQRYVDTPSWVDFLIMQEVSKNIDGNLKTSCYFYKERDDDTLYFTSLWDFDLAYGVANYDNGYGSPNASTTSGFMIINDSCPWFNRMMRRPEFAAAVKAKYTQYRTTLLKDMQESIDENAAYIYSAAQNDVAKWHAGSSYDNGVSTFKNWLKGRLTWLDTQWLQ